MKSDNKQVLLDSQSTYRISQLVDASGVSRDMIKYYLRAKLLPTPAKPKPNLSLYTENHLELIKLIQRYQENTKLSLQEIAGVFAAMEYDANAIEIELLSTKHSFLGDDNIIPLSNRSDDSAAPSFSTEFLQELHAHQLIDDGDVLDKGEEQLASLLWVARQSGIPLTFFQSAKEKLAELADLEVKTLIAIKRPDLSFNATLDSLTESDRIINRWLVAEKSRQARDQFQRVIDNSEQAISTLLENIYRPSDVFRARHHVDEMISQLTSGAGFAPQGLEQLHHLCRTTLLLSEFDLTIDYAENLLTNAPEDEIVTAYLSLAHAIQGDVEQAYSFGARLEHYQGNHPTVVQARVLSMLLQAAKERGVTDTNELMKRSGELFLDLLAAPLEGEPETTLIIARANVAFPDFANSRQQAIAALQALRLQLESGSLSLPSLPIEGLQECLLVIYRIYTLYYLGMLYHEDGDTVNATECLERVIQLDPSSNFAQKAFLKIGGN